MTDLRKAAEMALEALERCEYGVISNGRLKNSIEALRQALAQPEQEKYVTEVVAVHENGTYTTKRTPIQKREWFGLNHFEGLSGLVTEEFYAGAVWAEKKLKEMNGG